MLTLASLKNRSNVPQKQFKHHFLEEKEIVEVPTEFGRHYRTPEGDIFPSVTTFLSKLKKDGDGLEKWKAKLGSQEAVDAEMKRTADRGTGVHLALEWLLRNSPEPSHSGIYLKMYRQLESLLVASVDDVYGLEIPLYSKLLRLAGRVDCIARWKGVLSIIDFKTASSFKRTDWIQNYFLQTTAYSLMLRELYGLEAEQIVILIAVENQDRPQIFVKQRSEYFPILAEKLKEFREIQKDWEI